MRAHARTRVQERREREHHVQYKGEGAQKNMVGPSHFSHAIAIVTGKVCLLVLRTTARHDQRRVD